MITQDTGHWMCDNWSHLTELGSTNYERFYGEHKPKNESKSRAIVGY